MVDQQVKTCLRCQQSLPVTSFSKHSNTKDGLQAMCKSCSLEVQREYRKTAKGKARDKRYEQSDKKALVWKRYRDKPEVRERLNQYMRERVSQPLEAYKMYTRAALLRGSQSRGRRKAEVLTYLTGLSTAAFQDHLHRSFVARYGRDVEDGDEIHIDHIVPLSSAKSFEEVDLLSHYSNLQWLLAIDNNRKHTSTEVPEAPNKSKPLD